MKVVAPHNQHWHIFINPTAGAGRAASCWVQWYPQLAKKIPKHTLHTSTHRQHLCELAQHAIVEMEARFLLVVGGDGALHEVVNGMCTQTQVPVAELILAMLPVGTGNDWIKSHPIPRHFDRWLEMFGNGQIHEQSIGQCHFHVGGLRQMAYFVNAAGMAFDAYVVRYANSIKRRWMTNRFFYLWAIVRCLFQYRLKPAQVQVNGQTIRNRFYTITCGIGQYAGGGMQITPHAQPTNRTMAITLAGPLSPLAVLWNTYRFYNGTIGDHPQVSLLHSASIHVESKDAEPVLLEADGEFLGHSPVHLQMSTHRLRFIAG